MISVDNVYKTVQRILNKEQRGYLPPNEFNYFADLANTEVFENYFYELDQYMRVPPVEDDEMYGKVNEILTEKIHVFEQQVTTTSAGQVNFDQLPDFYRFGDINGDVYDLEEVSEKEYKKVLRSPLTASRANNGMFYRNLNGLFTSVPATVSYVRKPVSPSWAYMTVSGKAIYDGSNSIDFELHASDLPDVVIKIAGYAGVAIKAPDVAQAAAAKEATLDQSEKQ